MTSNSMMRKTLEMVSVVFVLRYPVRGCSPLCVAANKEVDIGLLCVVVDARYFVMGIGLFDIQVF